VFALGFPALELMQSTATSAVDLQTDQAIQEVIQSDAFADVTILTIA